MCIQDYCSIPPHGLGNIEVQAGPIWHCTLGYVYSLDSFEEKGKDWCGNAIEDHSEKTLPLNSLDLKVQRVLIGPKN